MLFASSSVFVFDDLNLQIKKQSSTIHGITLTLVLTYFLYNFQLLAEAVGPELTVKLMLPTILSMANDAVANVRFNVAKTLQRLGKSLDST